MIILADSLTILKGILSCTVNVYNTWVCLVFPNNSIYSYYAISFFFQDYPQLLADNLTFSLQC